MSDDLIEKMAAGAVVASEGKLLPIHEMDSIQREAIFAIMRGALDAISGRGSHVVVPVELTDAMKDVAAHISDGPDVSYQEHWQAMLNARPRE